MINKNKKGLSDVVTTVLIILFAVVAVAVIGAIVLNQVKGTGGKIDSATMCADFKIDAVKCYNGTLVSDTNVSILRGSGGSSFTVSEVYAIVEKADGTTEKSADLKSNFQTAQSSKAVTISTVKIMNAKKAGVAVVLKDSDGKDVPCDYYKTTKVDCA